MQGTGLGARSAVDCKIAPVVSEQICFDLCFQSDAERSLVGEMALTCAQRSKALVESVEETRRCLCALWQRHGAKVESQLEKYANKRPLRSRRFKNAQRQSIA